MLIRSKKNTKKIWGTIRPADPCSGHTFIFRAIFTGKISRFANLSKKELLKGSGSVLVEYKCDEIILFNVGLNFVRFPEPPVPAQPRPQAIFTGKISRLANLSKKELL